VGDGSSRRFVSSFVLDDTGGCGCIGSMKMDFLKLLAISCLLTVGAGCVSTVDGRVRAGVPFVKDKIESRYERPLDQVMAAARETLQFNGTLYSEDVVNKSLEGKVDTRTIWVKLDEPEPSITRVVVQVRTKGGRSDVDLASEIDKQIALRLVR
jgi:hypothetical protein